MSLSGKYHVCCKLRCSTCVVQDLADSMAIDLLNAHISSAFFFFYYWLIDLFNITWTQVELILAALICIFIRLATSAIEDSNPVSARTFYSKREVAGQYSRPTQSKVGNY